MAFIKSMIELNYCINLGSLYLRYNKISRISGLESLVRLGSLYISHQKGNPLRDVIEKLGGLSSVGYALQPKNLVDYSKNNLLD